MRMVVSYDDMLKSLYIAIERIKAINGRPDHSSRYDKNLSFHEYVCQIAESICAEIVVARYFGNLDFEPTVNTFKTAADVEIQGSKLEVKWTKYDAGALIISETDRNSDVAILVTGRSPNYDIKGWIPVSIAKDRRWKRREKPSFWVEQYHLHPIENLRRSSHGEAAIPLSN